MPTTATTKLTTTPATPSVASIAAQLRAFRGRGVRIRPTARATLKVRGGGLLSRREFEWLRTHKAAVLDYFEARSQTEEVATTSRVEPGEYRRVLVRRDTVDGPTWEYSECGCTVDPSSPDWCECRELKARGRRAGAYVDRRLSGDYRDVGLRKLARSREQFAAKMSGSTVMSRAGRQQLAARRRGLR